MNNRAIAGKRYNAVDFIHPDKRNGTFARLTALTLQLIFAAFTGGRAVPILPFDQYYYSGRMGQSAFRTGDFLSLNQIRLP